jgi:xylulokinase
MPNLLGIDIGTSGCKAVLIDERGKVLAETSAEYPVSMPKPTWSEQSPEDWWAGVQDCLRHLYSQQPTANSGQLAAIGVTGQMHGAVFLDDNGEVIRPAILWNDQRTAQECLEIEEAIGRVEIRRITCNPPLTGFQLPKLLWLRKHEPENFARVRTVLLPKDYIRFKLTGEIATDVTDASGTGLFDVPGRKWSEEIASRLGIDLGLFPACHESSTVMGRGAMTGFVSEARDIALEGDATAGIPVVAGAGDQAAGAVGTGTASPGIISVSLGTSGVVFACLEEPQFDPEGALHTFCHANGRWHAMGVMLSCGGALSWYRNAVRPGTRFSEIDEEAERARPGCDGLTFLPYLSGERSPHNDPHARGAWAGLTLSHGGPQMSRSVLEGVTFGLFDSLERIKRLGGECREIRVTGGGAKSRFWRQLIADVFQAECSTLAVDQGPAFGAALLAGVGIGIWSSVEAACAATVTLGEAVQPSGIDYSEPYRRFRSLYPALKDWK